MKKLIQISLLVVLVLVLSQAAAAAPVDSASQIGSHAATSISSTAVEDAHAAACLVYIKGIVCVTPNVGWNT